LKGKQKTKSVRREERPPAGKKKEADLAPEKSEVRWKGGGVHQWESDGWPSNVSLHPNYRDSSNFLLS